MFYQHKLSLLLLPLILLFIFNNNIVYALQKELPKDCYTYSDCQEYIKDPWEGFNRKIFTFNEVVNKYFLKPVTQAYDYITPSIIKRGISNFFNNLKEPVTGLNSLLQEKGNKAGISLTRFLFNSTLGLGGILDISGYIGLDRFNESFNQTLAFWGVESGNYVVLPFLGPSSVRGVFGLIVDYPFDPLTSYARGDDGITDPYTAYTNKEGLYSLGIYSMRIIDKSYSFLKNEKELLLGISDKYYFFRRTYFQNLKFQIYDGNVPHVSDSKEDKELEDMLE